MSTLSPLGPRRYRRAPFGLAIVLVTIAGSLLRLHAVDFGLPDRLRPDEELIVDRAARLGGAAGWNPKFAEYPAGQIYAIRALGSLAQRVVGKHWSIDEPSGIRSWYLTARLLSAALGTATIPLAAAFAGRMSAAGGDTATAGLARLVAATLVAGSFLHARDSHFATTDVAMTFWVTLAWLAIANVAERGRRRDSLAAGALVGVATATKYPALSLLVPLALAHLLGPARGAIVRRRSTSEAGRDPAGTTEAVSTHARFGLASIALLLAFTALTPYVILDAVSTRGAVANIGGQVFTDTYVNGSGSLAWLFDFAWPAALGWPLAVLAIAAVCASAVLGGRIERLVVVWFVASSLPLVFSHLVFLRYLLPLIPSTMALVAVWTARIASRARGIGVALAIVLAALVPSIVRAVELDRLVRETDTRSLAREWMETHLPAGTRIHSPAFIPGFPFYVPAALRGEFFYLPLAEGEVDRLPAGSYVLVATHPLAARIASDKLEKRLRDDAELLFDFDPTNRATAAPSTYEPADAFFAPLSGFATVVRPGPRLTLFRLGR